MHTFYFKLIVKYIVAQEYTFLNIVQNYGMINWYGMILNDSIVISNTVCQKLFTKIWSDLKSDF